MPNNNVIIIERRGLPTIDVITISSWNYIIDILGCITNYKSGIGTCFIKYVFLDKQDSTPSLLISLLLGFPEIVAYNTYGWVIRRLRRWLISYWSAYNGGPLIQWQFVFLNLFEKEYYWRIVQWSYWDD